MALIVLLCVSRSRSNRICSDKTERQRNCREQAHQSGTVRGPLVKNDFGKLSADKRCKETAEENKTAEDAEKNRQPRGGRQSVTLPDSTVTTLELALVLVRFDHIARRIVNANQSPSYAYFASTAQLISCQMFTTAKHTPRAARCLLTKRSKRYESAKLPTDTGQDSASHAWRAASGLSHKSRCCERVRSGSNRR